MSNIEEQKIILQKWLEEEVKITDEKVIKSLLRDFGKLMRKSEDSLNSYKSLFQKLSKKRGISEKTKLKLYRTLIVSKLIDVLNLAPQDEQEKLLTQAIEILGLPYPSKPQYDNNIYA